MITLVTRDVRLHTIALVVIHGVMTVLLAGQGADVLADIVLCDCVVIRPAVMRGVNISVPPGRVRAVVAVAARIPVAGSAIVAVTGAVVAVPAVMAAAVLVVFPAVVPASVLVITVAGAVIALAHVAAQVFAIAGQTAFVLAYLAPVLADVSEAVVAAEAALVQPARTLGHLICTHALQPMDAIGQILPLDPLLGPAANDLAQAITEGGTARP
jgi:hypothetical protein